MLVHSYKGGIVEIPMKTDYALRMLSALVREPEAIVSVRKAAEQNGVPYSFARAIQHDLTRAGIIESVRGARGGMRLAIDPAQMKVLEIVEALQGAVLFMDCGSAGEGGNSCPILASCGFTSFWCGAEHVLRSYLASATLEDVIIKGSVPISSVTFSLVSAQKGDDCAS